MKTDHLSNDDLIMLTVRLACKEGHSRSILRNFFNACIDRCYDSPEDRNEILESLLLTLIEYRRLAETMVLVMILERSFTSYTIHKIASNVYVHSCQDFMAGFVKISKVRSFLPFFAVFDRLFEIDKYNMSKDLCKLRKNGKTGNVASGVLPYYYILPTLMGCPQTITDDWISAIDRACTRKQKLLLWEAIRGIKKNTLRYFPGITLLVNSGKIKSMLD